MLPRSPIFRSSSGFSRVSLSCSWNSTSCDVTGPASFPLPVMCFGQGYIWSTPVDTAHFLIGHRNLTVINSEINDGNIYIDQEYCAPVGMDT